MLNRYPKGDPNLVEYLHMITPSIYSESAKMLLEKVEDPLVISTCVKALLTREDDGLLPVIVAMISKGQISAESAAELLTKKPEQGLWAMKAIAGLDQSPSSDDLLTAILPSVVDEYTQSVPEWLEDLLLRALTVEKSRDLILRYLKILVGLDRDEVWQVLIDMEKFEEISHKDFIEFLKLDPKKAYVVLWQNNGLNRYSEDILRLEQDFPFAAGLLTPGMTLSTPFGEVQIVNIMLIDGTIRQSVKKAEGNFILQVSSGTGLEKIEADLDFSQRMLQFKNENQIFCCSVCNSFYHPKQRKIDEHHRKIHPYEQKAFVIRHGSIPFSPDDIDPIESVY